MMTGADELWQVRLSNGATVAMTVDELDAAFHAGRVDARTAVLPPGELAWTTLGAAAGLDSAEAAPYSVAPVAADVIPARVPEAFDVETPPRRRRFSRVMGVALGFFVLICAGVAIGGYAARPDEVRAKLSELRSKATATTARAAAVAPPAAAEAAETATAKPSEPEPPAAARKESAANLPQPAVATTTVDNLPDAKAAKKSGARPGKRAPKHRGRK